MSINITIIGMGLMGASLAGALQGFGGAKIKGADASAGVCQTATQNGFVSECTQNTAEAVKGADVIIFCTYAGQISSILRQCLPFIKEGALVCDICGVKTPLYEEILPMLAGSGIRHIGLHPMAGRERDGIENADPALYNGSSMLLCPTATTQKQDEDFAAALAKHIGCAAVKTVNWQKHDEIIAYTSDLMHISASALCIDYPEEMSREFTAGAYRDCTRVANINAPGWTELLCDNRLHTMHWLGKYIDNLNKIHAALENNDKKELCALLQTAQNHKLEMLEK